MTLAYTAPWHRASFDRFVHDRLPALLAERLPLAGYQAVPRDNTIDIAVTVNGTSGDVTAHYTILQPDEEGVFHQENFAPRVVVPLASSADLDIADIRCVGEQLHDHIEDKLGEASEGMEWDELLLRRWLPLEEWVGEYLSVWAQWQDTTNRLAEIGHLRRVFIADAVQPITPSQFGRTCPFEVPEGPNLPRVRSIALGAEIRDGRLVIVDDRPEAGLGLTASLVPFLAHNNPTQQLMGVNMIRQWIPPANPEPALVQTGNEPAIPGIWNGYNLLTAYVSWGSDTYEDALLMSESCAKRLHYTVPAPPVLHYAVPVEPGDKFSNRHGAKGVVSRIVPDAEMPHLPDGTPVELVYNAVSVHARMNMGLLREAVMGRIARAEGAPAVVQPYQIVEEAELRTRLRQAGLPEDGMEYLTRDGEKLPYPSMVGWVYWGRTVHISEQKIHASVTPDGACQVQGELEFYTLRDVGAYGNLLETYNTKSAGREDAATFAARVAAGPITQAPPSTPRFAEISARLAIAGIKAELSDDGLAFTFAQPEHVLSLATPVPHPWLHERELTGVGISPALPEYAALEEANSRLQRFIDRGAPASLRERAAAELRQRVEEFFAALLTQGQDFWSLPPRAGTLLRPYSRVMFSGRTVLAPAHDLRLDQVGIPDEIAWTIFGSLVQREMGEGTVERTPAAAQVLDALMARSWVIINRAPTVIPTALLAFHPVRVPGRAFRLHPLACMLMNADFDGDQAAVFLPLTEETQREAEQTLSIAAHLSRDPSLIRWLCPANDAMWGLAWLSLREDGRRQIADITGMSLPAGLLTRPALTEILAAILQADGVEQALAVTEGLYHLGLAAAKSSGASISPFLGSGLPPCELPESNDPAAWKGALEECSERLLANADYDNPDLGPQLLAVKSGARGRVANLQALLVGSNVYVDIEDRYVPVRHGFVHGVTPPEMQALVVQAREALHQCNDEGIRRAYGVRQAHQPEHFTVLARAMRSDHPGLVFARAAATGEVDPLTDLTSRLFVGLPPARP
ncbi:MAG: hypothetical protein ACYDBB_21700 [Armatimonadota bacterium]